MSAEPTPRDTVNALLAGLQKWTAERAATADKINAAIKKIHAKHHADLHLATTSIAGLEKELTKYVKQHHADLMAGEDRIELPAGSVNYKTESRVKRIKGMLAQLTKFRLAAAIKPGKATVNWDMVEKFNDGTLQRLGTGRKKFTSVSYELKDK